MSTINKIKKVLHIVIFSIVFISCEEDVTNDITLNSIERLVIEGGIERKADNTTQVIKLTKSIPFLDNSDNPFVSDAIVTVSDGNTTWNFVYTQNGNYTNNNLLPEIGKTYTITIVWNNETYVGSDTLNEVPSFDNFYYEFEEETFITEPPVPPAPACPGC